MYTDSYTAGPGYKYSPPAHGYHMVLGQREDTALLFFEEILLVEYQLIVT